MEALAAGLLEQRRGADAMLYLRNPECSRDEGHRWEIAQTRRPPPGGDFGAPHGHEKVDGVLGESTATSAARQAAASAAVATCLCGECGEFRWGRRHGRGNGRPALRQGLRGS